DRRSGGSSARLRDRLLERGAGGGDAGPADPAGAGGEVPVGPVHGPTPARGGGTRPDGTAPAGRGSPGGGVAGGPGPGAAPAAAGGRRAGGDGVRLAADGFPGRALDEAQLDAHTTSIRGGVTVIPGP